MVSSLNLSYIILHQDKIAQNELFAKELSQLVAESIHLQHLNVAGMQLKPENLLRLVSDGVAMSTTLVGIHLGSNNIE